MFAANRCVSGHRPDATTLVNAVLQRFHLAGLVTANGRICGKVSTMSTVLVTNNLNVYKTVYRILKVSTSLIANDLNVYINVNVIGIIVDNIAFFVL